MRTIYSDVLCIGAGLAGERVALAAAMEGFHTICLSVVPPRRVWHSSAAQGGMQAALGTPSGARATAPTSTSPTP